MRIIKAHGQLQHHFWGTYYASIALTFESPEEASVALPMLPGWKLAREDGTALIWHGTDPAWTATRDLLENYGAENFYGCERSIDYGLPFTVEIPVADAAQVTR